MRLRINDQTIGDRGGRVHEHDVPPEFSTSVLETLANYLSKKLSLHDMGTIVPTSVGWTATCVSLVSNLTTGFVDVNGLPMVKRDNNTWGIDITTCRSHCNASIIPLVSALFRIRKWPLLWALSALARCGLCFNNRERPYFLKTLDRCAVLLLPQSWLGCFLSTLVFIQYCLLLSSHF